MVTEKSQYSALRCVSGIWQNNEKSLIYNWLRFIFTCLLTGALWVLFHMGRHTFATTITLMNDIPIETVSSMLGHAKISTTQIYAKVVGKKVMKDTAPLRAIYNDDKDKGIQKKTI